MGVKMLPPDLGASEAILLVVILLAFFGAIVVLARFTMQVFSNSGPRSLGRSMRMQSIEDGAMRASNADRDLTIERLREETTQGRLTFNELEERMVSAQSAKTLGDLTRLTQDLPEGELPSGP